MLDELNAQIWDKGKVVLVLDHYVPERDDESRRIVKIARDWAAEQALPHVYDGQGICHVVVPEHGHIRPGMLCVGGDSHSPTGGAFGAYMVEGGRTPMHSAGELGAKGFRIVIFPGGTARAVAHSLQGYYASLQAHGSTAACASCRRWCCTARTAHRAPRSTSTWRCSSSACAAGPTGPRSPI